MSNCRGRNLRVRRSAIGAVKHQRFAGTAYFDLISETISGGISSTTAMKGSTEEAQFSENKGATPMNEKLIEQSK